MTQCRPQGNVHCLFVSMTSNLLLQIMGSTLDGNAINRHLLTLHDDSDLV